MSAHSKRAHRITALTAAAVVAGAAACGSSQGGGSGPAGWIAVDYTLGLPFSLADAEFYDSFAGDASGRPPFEYRPEIRFGNCSAYPPLGSPTIRWRDVGDAVQFAGLAGHGAIPRERNGDYIFYSGDLYPPPPDVTTIADVTIPAEPSWLAQVTVPSMPSVDGWTTSDGVLTIDPLVPLALSTTSLGADEILVELSSTAAAEFCRFDGKSPVVIASSALETAPASGTITVTALHVTHGTLDGRELLLVGAQSRRRTYSR